MDRPTRLPRHAAAGRPTAEPRGIRPQEATPIYEALRRRSAGTRPDPPPVGPAAPEPQTVPIPTQPPPGPAPVVRLPASGGRRRK
jgi:hypothetical protein